MSDELAFLRGIRAHPDDDVPRLAFADWLDERGDHDRAEFVRLQCELEPVRGRYDLPGVFEREQREWELLDAHEADWLAAATVLPRPAYSMPRLGFRRGVVEVVRLSVDDLLGFGEKVIDQFPTLRELVVFHTRGRGRDLAACEHLSRFDILDVADWLTMHDPVHLTQSQYFGGVRTLRFRIGHRGERGYDAFISDRVMRPGPMRVESLELVQLYGGIAAGEEAAELNARANRLARRANRIAGRPIARVIRPYEQLLPLNADVGYGIYAGRLQGTTQAVVNDPANDAADEVTVYTFRKDGRLLRASDKALPASRTAHDWDDRVRRGLRFAPGPVAVREFSDPDRDFGISLFDAMHRDLLVSPDDEGPNRTDLLDHLVWWLARGNFVIECGNNYWADRTGEIHSS